MRALLAAGLFVRSAAGLFVRPAGRTLRMEPTSLSAAIHRAQAEVIEAQHAVNIARERATSRPSVQSSSNDLTSLLISPTRSDSKEDINTTHSVPSLLGHLRSPLDERLPWYRDARTYTRRELLADALVHASGISLGIAAMFASIIGAIKQYRNVWQYADHPPLMVAACIFVYGVSLLTMLVCSAIYNVGQKLWRRHVPFLALLDHIGICFLIAGSATPVMVFSCSWQGSAVLWILMLLTMVAKAVGGCLDNITLHVFSFVFGPILACWMSFEAMQRSLKPWQLDCIALSGIFYIGGLLPWGIRGLEFHVAIWHVCVVCGSASIFVLVYYDVDTAEKVGVLESTLDECFFSATEKIG